MHICFLTPEYSHPNLGKSGGLGTSIKNLATGLVANEVKVTIVVMGQKTSGIWEENGITIRVLKQKKYKFLGFYLYRRKVMRYLNLLIKTEGIDLIEAPDWSGITAFMSLKVPLVIRFHGSDAYFCKLDGRKQKKKNYWFEKLALQGADALISVSAYTAKETRNLFPLKKPIAIIPNSINIYNFQPATTPVVPKTILYFGTIIRKKGVLELPAIFNLVAAKHPDSRLIILGKDVVDFKTKESTKNMMEKAFSEAAKKQVSWLSELPYDEVRKTLANAEIVVLPSFAEALPMTWLEAMAMEKALVTSDIGWAKEVMVDGVTGFTVFPKEHQVYADKIIELMENKTLQIRMGKSARDHIINHFSAEVVTTKNRNFYRQIISENNAL